MASAAVAVKPAAVKEPVVKEVVPEPAAKPTAAVKKEEGGKAKVDIKDIKKEDLKKNAIIWTGNEESLKKAVSLLEEFGLPLGLLPLQEVVEIGFVQATGYVWISQKKKVEHNFKIAGKLVSYATDITGFLETKRIKKLSGVRAKELLIWVPVGDISIDEQNSSKIHFKSFGGITKTFAVEAFAAGQ